MTQAYCMSKENGDWLDNIRAFFTTLMEKSDTDAILVPAGLAMKHRIMPTLIADQAFFGNIDPLSPAFPVNAAQQLARLTRQPSGGRLVAVLRPCEIRSFIELDKLNQGKREAVTIIGIDCAGAMSNTDFRAFADRHESLDAATRAFCAASFGHSPPDDTMPHVTAACRFCIHPIPDGADIAVTLFGIGANDPPMIYSQTEEGKSLLERLHLDAVKPDPKVRQAAIDARMQRNGEYRKERFAEVAEATGSIEGLATYLADCVNCYNCRVACPVCYCTTCVFTTDTFRHEPFQYLSWARRKGEIKMPTDTLFFHLTRMAHMSLACVGCGQCTNACPNDIPLADLFAHVARHTQKAFEYEAGMDAEQRPPLSGFEENEYEEVVGIG